MAAQPECSFTVLISFRYQPILLQAVVRQSFFCGWIPSEEGSGVWHLAHPPLSFLHPPIFLSQLLPAGL